MKRKKILLLILFITLTLCINAKADTGLYLGTGLQFSTNANDSGNYVNKIYVASGKKLDFKFSGSTSEFSWGTGEEAVLLSKERTQKVVVNLSTSSNISCTISNLKSSIYDLNGNTFTLKDNNVDSKSIEGKIGSISCTLPTTDNIIKFSSNMYINITLNETMIDVANDQNTTKSSSESYKYQFGVANEKYLNSLNDKTSISSVTIDGMGPNALKIVDIDKPSVVLKIEQNALASKNQLFLEVDSEKKGEIIKKESITYKEKTINLPYGGTSVEIREITEKEKIIDELEYDGDDRISDFGFSNDTFYTKSNREVFVFNRIDNRSKVNTLKSLNITGVSLSFKPELKNYIASVPYKISSVTINSLLTDPKSTYTKGYGNRTVNLKEGLNTVQVKVKAENESETTYTIKITREKNDDASLKSLTVNDKSISLKNGLLIYSTNVNSDVIKPVIKATANDSKAKVEIEKFGDLKEGDNEISITVTASNGNKGIYVINIIRDKLISTNSKLKTLNVKDHEINFDPEKNDYNVHISYDVEKLDLNIETEHEKAKYVVTGNKDLENGSVIKVKVTAEDEKTISTYTINIEKDKKPFNILYIVIPAVILLLAIVIVMISKKRKENLSKNTSYTQNPNSQSEEKKDVDNENTTVNKNTGNDNLDSILVKKKD